MRDLTIEKNIAIFKSVAFLKVKLFALIKNVSIFTVERLNIIKKNFTRKKAKNKILLI